MELPWGWRIWWLYCGWERGTEPLNNDGLDDEVWMRACVLERWVRGLGVEMSVEGKIGAGVSRKTEVGSAHGAIGCAGILRYRFLTLTNNVNKTTKKL